MEIPPQNKVSVKRSPDYFDRDGRYQRQAYDQIHQPEALERFGICSLSLKIHDLLMDSKFSL